jgi:2-oxo-4-hydroxy-4-carboxy-5-ureidoimidazoline decarboxylase
MSPFSTRRRTLRGLAAVAAALTAAPQSVALAQAAAAPVTLDAVNRMDEARFVEAFGNVFELSPWVARAAFAKRPFATVSALYEAMMDAFRSASRQQQVAFFRGLSDIGDKHVASSAITDSSRREQARGGIGTMAEADLERLMELNQAYKARFGYGYTICVLRSTPETVLAQLRRRLKNDPDTELAVAMREQAYIVRLRIAELVAGPGSPRVFGDLNTHVLDAVSGTPAAGMRLELYERFGERLRRVAEVTTNALGRADILKDRPVPIGRYELRFQLADYFRSSGVPVGDQPFIDYVPVRFAVDDAEGHYHLPLICTPWTFATYRGS